MKKWVILFAVLLFTIAPAKIVKKSFMNTGKNFTQLDAATYESMSSRKKDMGWSSLHGNAMIEYMGSGNKKEVLIVTSDPNVHMLHIMVTRENNNGLRQLRNEWCCGYGNKGSTAGHFKSPGGVCIVPSPYFSSDGLLWVFVADEGNNRVAVLKYNTKNHQLNWHQSIGSSSSLSKPKDVSCEWIDQNDGKLLMAVASSGDNKIAFFHISFTSGGITTSSLSSYQASFDNPTSVKISRKITNNFYMFISDSDNHRIRRTDLYISGYTLNFYWTKTKDLPDEGEYYISAVGNDEQVVFLHDISHSSFYAYDWLLDEVLYGGPTEYSSYMSFMQGECLMSNEWTQNSGLEYYWLDSEFKEAGAIPNTFKIGQQDVAINYILTGGGKVTIDVCDNFELLPLKIIEDDDPQLAGRHWVIWDGKDSRGQYVSPGHYRIRLHVDENYVGDGNHTSNSSKMLDVEATNTVSSFKTGFETGESPPYENTIISNTFASNVSASVVTAENGVSPHSGSQMYKVSGQDTSINSIAGFLECKLFELTNNYQITDPMFLSFWVYGKDFPKNETSGRIVIEGTLNNGTSLRNWVNYGQILDNKSNGINPDSMTVVPQGGQWHQYVFALTPAAGQILSVIKITYLESAPLTDTGSFVVYFDDLQLTTLYPGNDMEWYPEHFANGIGTNHTNADCNFDMHYWANNAETSLQQGRFPWIALQVDGHGDSQGGGSYCECLDADTVWISPSPGPGIRMQIPDVTLTTGKHLNAVDASTTISWWQYDRAHALVVGAKLREVNGTTNWLYWVWNDPAKWNSAYFPGYVDMNGAAADTHTYRYNQWEGPFTRKISADYYNEYGSTPTEILDLRIAHYLRSDWNGNKGGHINDLYLGGSGGWVIDTIPHDTIPDPPPLITDPVNGGSIMSIGQTGLIRDQRAKNVDITWSLGSGTGGGAPRKCELYFSRDGGQTFTEEISDSISPGTLVVLDTIIIDDTLPTVRYCWNGSYEWDVATPPTLESMMKLVVEDSTGDTTEYTSNQFQIHIPSALEWPLEGNANLNAFKTVTVGGGGYYLAWTTRGAADTTKRHILYLHSTDGKKWDTLATPTINNNAIEGHRPSLILTSATNPQVLLYNNSSGGLYSTLYDQQQGWLCQNLTPPSFPSGSGFTANTVMGTSDTVHFGLFADTGTSTIVLYAKKKFPFTSQLSGLTNLGSYTYQAPEGYAPSIALDKNNKPHIVYRIASKCYYAFYNGSSWVRDSFPSDTTLEPSVACKGNNVVILYRNSSGSLVRKLGYLNGTLTSTSEIPDSKGKIADPRLVGRDVVVFADTSDSGSFKVRFSQFDAEVNSFSYPVPISDVNRNAYSPQGMVMDDGSLWLLWTENLITHNKIAYLGMDPLYESPVTEIDCGYAATPFTIYRAGIADYDGIKADTGDSVTYSLTGMSSTKHHTMLVEFFYHDENVTSTNYIINCGSVVDTETVEEGYVNQFYIDVDSGVTTIPLKVFKGDSITASVRRIVAYELSSQGTSRVGKAVAAGIPVSFVMYQNTPNPFANSTTIRYALPYATNVSLKVYDISGRRVSVLREGKQKAGIYTLQWNGRDNNNVKLASGVYFIRFEADKYTDSKKAVILH